MSRSRRRRRNPITSPETVEIVKWVGVVAGLFIVYEILQGAEQTSQNLLNTAINAPGQAASSLGTGIGQGLTNLSNSIFGTC